MGLVLRKDGDRVRRAWYGQYCEDGKRKVVRLSAPMRGERIPGSLSERGDEAFERSRVAAQAEFDRFEDERKHRGIDTRMTERLIELKTGRETMYVEVAGLEAHWRRLHPRERSEKQESNIRWFFRLFCDAVKHRRFVYEVTADDVAGFYSGIRSRLSWSTVRRVMHLLRGAFAGALPVGWDNPFGRVELVADKTAEVVHRRPLSDAELARVFAEARKTSPLAFSLAVAAACTGLRIGDVCNLRWGGVDLSAGLISLRTRKTGQSIFVPIFAPFRAVLEVALAETEDGAEYVFPGAKRLFDGNYNGLVRMGKLLFARALFGGGAVDEGEAVDVDAPEKSPADVLEAIRSARWSASKREKVERVYTLYATGLGYRSIERETGFSRGQISMYLHDVEREAGASVIKFAKAGEASTAALLRKTRKEREGAGARAASVYGWHSLRGSFVVAALNAGVPLETVRRIVGHTTADMTLEYFNPTKAIVAETVRQRMAGSVIGGGSSAAAARSVGGAGAASALAAHPSNALPPPVAPVVAAGGSAAGGGLEAMVAAMSPSERERLRALLG